MSFPLPTEEEVEFFAEHGWLVVRDAVPQADLDELERHCDIILENKEKLAYDWAWDEKEKRGERSFRFVQSSPSLVWPEVSEQAYRKWMVVFGSALMGRELDFWYDQFLAKPPGKSVATNWHQDEGYWGRNLEDKGVTCWLPLHDVDATNGCMHFTDSGHTEGVLEHRNVDGVQANLLVCEVDEIRTVICPLKRGDVTFHHSKTPHMTTANVSDAYRKAVSNHMKAKGVVGEGAHFPWRVFVNQTTGERTTPEQA